MLPLIAMLMAPLWLSGCAERRAAPHVIDDDTTNWPEPGYRWVDPDDKDSLAVRWRPGVPYWERGKTRWPNVMAATSEGQWVPAPGYAWSNLDAHGAPIPGNLAVRWLPGQEYSYLGQIQWPHVIASTTEGWWSPAPGYAWSKLDRNGKPIPGNLAVHWQPGKEFKYLDDAPWPHVIAASTEGEWRPEPGYEWAHVDREGRPIPGQLAVVSSSERRAAGARQAALADRWIRYLTEIQAERDYPNWSGPPLDLYRANHRQ